MKNVKIILIIIVITFLVGCNSSSIDTVSEEVIPEITIQSGDTSIDYSVGLNYWNKAVYDRIDNFTIIIEDGYESLPYIELGNEVTISFNDNSVPDEYELYDYVLNKEGSPKYTNKEVREIPLNIENGTGSFILDMHFAALLSSNSDDYERGASIRGFKLICRWGEDECEYGFIVRSDAH
jgi:hypothetical protein